MAATAEARRADPAAAPTLAGAERRAGNTRRALRRFFQQRLAVAGLVVTALLILVGLFAPQVAPTPPEATILMDANRFPDRQYPLGTDAIGHDYLSRVIFGLRTSLVVGFAAVGVACLIGIPLGLAAGLRGGWVDFVTLRLVEVMTAFPGILFAMFLVAIVGGGVRNIVIVIGATSWVMLCRLTRGQLLTLREQEFVQAARSTGVPEARIAVAHLLPNALPPLIVAITLAIPTAIFTEAGLSFLGLGINEPTPSLGKMVADSAQYIRVYWHLGLFPTLAIALLMLGFTFVGDGLRDALDPRQN
ncbi:MAG: Dipeptide transport system permease protein DppC [uncultured Thermomicrobiales bacterium]|uniref:Dipeptide transport system permease protein DppC n=1 Tax=uncultured Thermomicrobiales bacterium TaxID=1645740 RepID=A0A6J4VGV1_9BACT|nr:MAG: Dipeptide transport system permease protein DppC [uncultured Thermomicrobiales bacterium]